MPKLSPTVTVSTTKEVRLEPKLRRKLLLELRTYQTLKQTLDATQAAMDKHKATIAELRDSTGEMSIEIEGFKTTMVAPIRKVFDPKEFVANGGDLQIYNNSIKDVPSKPYEKITMPGAPRQEEL